MSVTLWLDTAAEETIELGATGPVYAAFASLARAAGGDKAWVKDWPCLSGVTPQCETQEDADPEWVEDMRAEASSFLRRHGSDIDEDARDMLRLLADEPKTDEENPDDEQA